MLRLRLGAVALLVLANACGDDRIPLGIEAVGPQAPVSPGPQAPGNTGPGRLGSGGSDVASILIAPPSLTLAVGDSVRVVASAFDENDRGLAGVTFVWASGDTRIVRVRPDPEDPEVATVTAVGVGGTLITASAGDASASALVAVIGRP